MLVSYVGCLVESDQSFRAFRSRDFTEVHSSSFASLIFDIVH